MREIQPTLENISQPTPVISVVIPSLNQGEFLEQCLNSILSQTGDFIIDCIIVDGGSGDDTVGVIRRVEEHLTAHCEVEHWVGGTRYIPRTPDFPINRCRGIGFRWSSGPDKGQVDALKKGFAIGHGEVLTWLCADDYYLSDNVFAAVCRHFEDDATLSLLFGDGILVSRQGKPYGPHRVEVVDMRELILLDYHILQPATFFRRAYFLPEDLDESYLCAFDANFFIRKLSRGEKYLKVAEPYAAFRVYEDNKTVAMQVRKCDELLQISHNYPYGAYLRGVSRFYRLIEKVLRPNWHERKGIRHRLFVIFRALCYLLITGRLQRKGRT